MLLSAIRACRTLVPLIAVMVALAGCSLPDDSSERSTPATLPDWFRFTSASLRGEGDVAPVHFVAMIDDEEYDIESWDISVEDYVVRSADCQLGVPASIVSSPNGEISVEALTGGPCRVFAELTLAVSPVGSASSTPVYYFANALWIDIGPAEDSTDSPTSSFGVFHVPSDQNGSRLFRFETPSGVQIDAFGSSELQGSPQPLRELHLRFAEDGPAETLALGFDGNGRLSSYSDPGSDVYVFWEWVDETRAYVTLADTTQSYTISEYVDYAEVLTPEALAALREMNTASSHGVSKVQTQQSTSSDDLTLWVQVNHCGAPAPIDLVKEVRIYDQDLVPHLAYPGPEPGVYISHIDGFLTHEVEWQQCQELLNSFESRICPIAQPGQRLFVCGAIGLSSFFDDEAWFKCTTLLSEVDAQCDAFADFEYDVRGNPIDPNTGDPISFCDPTEPRPLEDISFFALAALHHDDGVEILQTDAVSLNSAIPDISSLPTMNSWRGCERWAEFRFSPPDNLGEVGNWCLFKGIEFDTPWGNIIRLHEGEFGFVVPFPDPAYALEHAFDAVLDYGTHMDPEIGHVAQIEAVRDTSRGRGGMLREFFVSPDGRRIAFRITRSGYVSGRSLFPRMDALSEQYTVLTDMKQDEIAIVSASKTHDAGWRSQLRVSVPYVGELVSPYESSDPIEAIVPAQDRRNDFDVHLAFTVGGEARSNLDPWGQASDTTLVWEFSLEIRREE